ncbi:aminoacetone oxidase family FAD-binding enzyme, partial [Xanthomonas euvesicatoria]
MQHYDAIILGAGAAGLMAAATAGQRGRRVLVVDHADAPGKKILISGGGRCNFTNIGTAPDRFLSANPHFAKSALGRYTAADFLALVEAHGIAWHEKTLGQLFCDGSARQIVEMLLDECDRAARAGGLVDIALDAPLDAVTHDGTAFRITRRGDPATAPRLIVATGGPSIPKMGATGYAYDLARQFSLKVVEPRPALVPLTLGGEETLFRSLSGVASEVVARAGKTRFREAALFTHRGLSGPAILQVSSYWRHGEPIGIDFTPDAAPDWLVAAKRAQPRLSPRRALGQHLPDRLAETLTERLALPAELGSATDKLLAAAQGRLADWTFHPNGSEGYAKAEVTVGGVSTAGLSSRTMEAKT